MNFYQKYSELNSRLCAGQRLYCRKDSSELEIASSPGSDTRPLHYPRIGIYTGKGSSHSWLWFVELFERSGFHELSFLDEQDVQDGLEHLDVLAISGGDTFSMATALKAQGAKNIKKFVAGGGLYLGSCAGAYLPLCSSKEPLHLFNFVPAKITNLSKNLPQTSKMAHKAYACYGCQYLFHPVREEVALQLAGEAPFCSSSALLAPLYGGPGLIPSDSVQTLARYSGFTEKTLYLVDPDLARKTLIDQAAAVRCQLGQGCFYLFGPHLEHPHFPEANRLILDSIYWESFAYQAASTFKPTEILKGQHKAELLKTLKRELSNSRIVATGLELMPIYWMIGNKAYEPLKIRVFLEPMWKRLNILEKSYSLKIRPGTAHKMSTSATQGTQLLRELKKDIDQGLETTALAAKCFKNLQELATNFFASYFQTISLKPALNHNPELRYRIAPAS
jgi:glutamine amidotransferase-like uncharacterized protein